MNNKISQAQARLLAEQYLNTIGQDKSFYPKETLTALQMLAGYIIDEASNNLSEGGHVSSGKLISSLIMRDPVKVGDSVKLEIEALEYLRYINKGVKGTRGGSGTYSFKSSYPSKKMVTEIEAWMKRGGIRTSTIPRSISATEPKDKSISQFSAAYAMARSIKMKGIKATGFFDKAVEAGENKATTELEIAFSIDIINSLPDKL